METVWHTFTGKTGKRMDGALNWVTVVRNNCNLVVLLVFNIQILLSQHNYKILLFYFMYFLWLCSPARAMASSSTRFLDHTQRRATVGRTTLDE